MGRIQGDRASARPRRRAGGTEFLSRFKSALEERSNGKIDWVGGQSAFNRAGFYSIDALLRRHVPCASLS